MCAYSSCQFAFAITEDELEFSSPSVILCVSPYKIIPKSTHKYGQTERAEEQTLCRSCAVSPVCDTDTHTHTHTYTHTQNTWYCGHTYTVRIIQQFAIPILSLICPKALPGTQSGDQQITQRSGNIPEIYWTDWGKQQQISVRLEFEFHKKPVDHEIR